MPRTVWIAGFVLCVGTGCDVVQKKLAASLNTPRHVSGTQKLVETEIEGLWTDTKILHDAANLQLQHPLSEMYLIVLSEAKADFDEASLGWHSDATRKVLMQNLKKGNEVGPKKIKIGDLPAIEYEITGVVDNIKLAYIHATVETEAHFHQVLGWTLRSRQEKNFPKLRKRMQGLRFTAGIPPSTAE